MLAYLSTVFANHPRTWLCASEVSNSNSTVGLKCPTVCCLVMLQPGDCVILNGANSTVGQVIIQLCSLLQLRCVAVVRQRSDTQEGFAHTADRLKALGASLVVQDTGSLKVGFCCYRPSTCSLPAHVLAHSVLFQSIASQFFTSHSVLVSSPQDILQKHWWMVSVLLRRLGHPCLITCDALQHSLLCELQFLLSVGSCKDARSQVSSCIHFLTSCWGDIGVTTCPE